MSVFIKMNDYVQNNLLLILILENIDGEWSEWGDWSICAADFCTYANITRNRTCDNPPPKNEGKDCEGSSISITTCFNDSCPSMCPLYI